MADWNFYLAYNLFRIAAILQGIAKRVEAGTASSAQAVASGRRRAAAGRDGLALRAAGLTALAPQPSTHPRRHTWTSTTPQDQGTAGQAAQRFMDEHIYPTEAALRRPRLAANTKAGKRWTPLQTDRGAEAQGARRGPVEPVPAGRQRRRLGLRGRRPDQPGIRAAGRDHGPRALGAARSSTARRPTPATWKRSRATAPRSTSSAGSSRCSTARSARAFAMTEPDVASSRRHQHRDPHRARRRRVRDQRPQVVDLRRRRPALQGLHHHGQDRPRRAAPFAADR